MASRVPTTHHPLATCQCQRRGEGEDAGLQEREGRKEAVKKEWRWWKAGEGRKERAEKAGASLPGFLLQARVTG